MATVEQCDRALRTLADRLDGFRDEHPHGAGRQHDHPDRSLSCTIRDLDVVFTGRLAAGRLTGIARSESADAQIRVDLTGDDLLALVDGSLDFASAWLSGRVKITAGVRDLLRLRSLF